MRAGQVSALMPAPDRTAAGASLFARAYWPAVALIFAGGLVLRLQTFTQPWIGAHNAWGGAYYSNVARNFVRYGLDTKLAPVVNTGTVDPAQFDVYYHHPVLSMWVTAVDFRIFGEHEWTARLAPLVFSLLTLALVFRIALAAFGRGPALLSLLFLSILPVDAYYAAHLDPYGSMALFFTLLAVESYRRWFTGGRRAHLLLCATSIALGCWTSWYTYLVIPGIVAHAWFAHPREWRRQHLGALALLPAISVGVFALFMLHRQLSLPATGSEVYGALSQRLLLRTVDLPVDRVEVLQRYLRDIWNLYTIPIILLIATWLMMFARDVVKRRTQIGDWCIVILLSFGFLYALAFPGHLLSHDYFTRAYAPGVALACAIALTRLSAALARGSTQTAVAAAFAAIACVVATMRTQSLYGADDRTYGVNVRAQAAVIGANAGPGDSVYMAIPEDRILAYYADRPMAFEMDSPAKADSLAARAKAPYVIVVPSRDAPRFPDLVTHLRAQYTERVEDGLFVFRSDAKRSPR